MMRKVPLGSTFYFAYGSRAFATGIPEAVASGDLSAIELDGTNAVIDTGITTAAHGSLAAVNIGTCIATTANGYEAGKTYAVVLDTGTVDSVSAVGEVVYEFQIETVAERAQRALGESLFGAGHVLGASGSHSQTAIDLTGVVDADTADDALKGLTALVVASNGNQNHVRITGFTNSTLVAVVNKIDDGGVMDFTPGDGTLFFLTGFDATTRNGSPLAVTGDEMDLRDAPNATAIIAIQDGLATSAALQTVDDEVADIDTVVDAIKAKTDSLTFTVAGEVDANAVSMNDAAIAGDGTALDLWRGA
jgi:hypothetical protein